MRWTSEPLGLNVAFLVGHGTVRGAVMGAEAGAATDAERAAMVREVEAALDAGAFGLSSGLIYAPGMHADADELAALVATAARRGGLYATHMRNEGAGLFESLAESIGTIRAARDAGADGPRLQVSHLKCGARAVWGRAAEAIAVLEAARAEGLDVAADQYPYTAAATTLATILPPSLLGLGVEECVAALGDHEVRDRVVAEMERGISGLGERGRGPGLGGHPDLVRAQPSRLGGALAGGARRGAGRGPGRSRHRRADRRSPGRVGRHRVHGRGGRRDDPGRALDRGLHRRRGSPAGSPDPRRRAAASAHVREHRARARHVRPRARHARARDGRRQAQRRARGAPGPARSRRPARGRLRRPRRVRPGDRRRRRDLRAARRATRIGIEHVVVNGRPAVLAGQETGERAGRLLRRAG